MVTKLDKYLILIVAILIFYLYYLSTCEPRYPNPLPLHQVPSQSGLKLIKAKLDSCIQEAAKIHYENATNFFTEFRNCIKTYIPFGEAQMDNLFNKIGSERKMFLPMSKEYPQGKCKWLTVGIGGTTTAERAFKEKYPQCKMYGVEITNAGDFAKLGTVIPHGVGVEDAEIELSQLVDKKRNKYQVKKAKVLSLTRILDEFVKSRFIHYMTIDIEGLEYFILAELVENGKFARDGIKFCQIDAELHSPRFEQAHPLIKRDFNRVQFILDFLRGDSPYLPIFNVPYSWFPHQKVTFINVVDPECEQAFHISSYFVNA